VMMQTYWDRGDKEKARAYADTARVAFEAQLAQTPQDPQLHVLYGLALAYAGKKAQAIAEGEKGRGRQSLATDKVTGAYMQHQMVRIYILVGEPEKALTLLEELLSVNYALTPAWLK